MKRMIKWILRHYFAAMALNGLLSNPTSGSAQPPELAATYPTRVARAARTYADEMLEAMEAKS